MSNGALTLNTDGSFSYVPEPGFSGIDSFSYLTSDSTAASASTVVNITVNPEPNEPPLAIAEGYSTDHGTVLLVDAADGVLANDSDADGDSLTAVLDSDVNNGTLSLGSDGSFAYVPSTGFGGTDSFTYYATDGRESSASVRVELEVGFPTFFAGDGVYDSDSEVVYKEYWISHEWFTGSDDCDAFPEGDQFFIEPVESSCPMFFNIGDDFSNAVRAEIFMDIWRGRTNPSVRFNLNNGITRQPDVGEDWSRTPYVGDIPLSELVTGTNVLNLSTQGGAYHVHDIAIRIYQTASQPLLNNGSPRVAPRAFLVSIEDDDKTVTDVSSSNVLTIDNDKITLTAFATRDARFLEFHAFYDGYDEDNDGFTRDWHNRTRNNWHPGGVGSNPDGGTIDHIGTVSVGEAGNYSIDWDVSHIPAQSGVRFKVRVLDSARDVRDAAGGVSAEFELQRETTNVQTFTIPNFQDGILYHDGLFPTTLDRTIMLPEDLSGFTDATIIASYWERPFLSINNNPDIPSFEDDEDDWQLSVRDVPMSYLQGGANLLTYKHNICLLYTSPNPRD